ncbi:MAG: DUF3368 domain-containing protein [Anaerolineales bacterium]|nr:DUF3368 domain-containing protein [Anaerolineales bacterium]MDW8447600.1 DUF3368 domain-containing protein [Anaerolineales bacterium]
MDRLSLLEALFGEVHIPPAVYREALAKSGAESQRLDEALARYIRVSQALELSPDLESVVRGLGAGEQQAIVLAHHLGALLLMDERLGRSAARRLGVRVAGVAGVLIRAKEAGLLSQVRPLLEAMRREGYWLSDAVLDTAARLAGEVE